MKTPPFSLFPLRALHVAPEYSIKPIAAPSSTPPPSAHWFTTVMANNNNNNSDHNRPSSHHKASLAFILDQAPDGSSGSETESDHELTAPLPVVTKRRRVSLTALTAHTTLAAAAPASPDTKKGSKYCIVDGCTSRAKHARKCWRHGGSVKCKVPECINRAKSKGVCWSHGGGTMCSHDECETIAVSHGFCWAHGGGKRCQVTGCSRPAYERTDNYCTTHHKQRVRAATAAAPTPHP